MFPPRITIYRASSAPTTGEDSTPPLKKRLLSRSVSSKVQTPNTSPNSRIASPATSRIATIPQGAEKQQQPQRTGTASVHTLFATDFFNNVSTGYNVLLHTFQYLKVQVCVWMLGFINTLAKCTRHR